MQAHAVAHRSYLTFIQLASYVGYEPKTAKMATKLAEDFVRFYGLTVYYRRDKTRLVLPEDVDKALGAPRRVAS